MQALSKLDSTVKHLNEIIADNDPNTATVYAIEPIAGTDSYSLWLDTDKSWTHVVTTNSEAMYTIVYALKHVHKIL